MTCIVSLLFTLFTATGPIVGGLGYYFGSSIVFWIGVAFALANLFMNLASGAMNFPLLPALFALVGAFILGPWYTGAGVGLLVWTAIEAATEVFPFGFRGRS